VISGTTSKFSPSIFDNGESSVHHHSSQTAFAIMTVAQLIISHDESTFTNKIPYTGSDSVTMDNGLGLPIKHIGSITYTGSSSSFFFL